MTSALSKAKLYVGKVASAWQDFPDDYRAFREMPAGPPILVTGVPRSGTTWVGRMLSPHGVWHVHEPFNPALGHWPTWFSYARPGDSSPEVDRLMHAVLSGKTPDLARGFGTDHRLMPMRMMRPPIRRVLVKDPIACLLSDYLTGMYGFRTMVVFRHPASIVNSLLRLRWPFVELLDQFLHTKPLMEDWLHPYAHLLGSNGRSEDAETAAVLVGSLATVLRGFCRRREVMKALFYEDLCLAPVERFRALYLELGLPYEDETAARHEVASNAPDQRNGRTYAHAIRRDSQEMIEKWKTELTPDAKRIVRDVWDQFDLDIYASDDDWD